MKTKQPKRIKTWVNLYAHGDLGIPRHTKDDAVFHGYGAIRVGVRLIEVRRGEVVVNVKALEEAFAVEAQGAGHLWDAQAALKAAIKKVGVR